MSKNSVVVSVVAFFMAIILGGKIFANESKQIECSNFEQEFLNPSEDTRLQFWYHWISDCVTEEGIIEDFRAMKELNVSVAYIFAAWKGYLPVKAKPMSDEFMRLFSVSIREAKKNNIKLGFHNCPGWTSSGGPWIKPENSMKKVVWTTSVLNEKGESIIPQGETLYGFYRDLKTLAIPPEFANEKKIPDLSKVVDVTNKLKDNSLSLPQYAGWTILRIGYTSTGAYTMPSSIEGLECDKLDRRGLAEHWKNMPGKILAIPEAKGTIEYCIIDSYEVGPQNWSEILPGEFQKRAGYSLTDVLPIFCDWEVISELRTKEIKRDLDRVIAELYAENYYDYFVELCHEAGVKAIIESYGGPFDSYRCARNADVVTGEFWIEKWEKGGYLRKTSSIAHFNGRKISAAESFTAYPTGGNWKGTPRAFRESGECTGWLNGVNQFVFHSYLHQPFTNVKPGLSLGEFGSQFNRNTTWWKEAVHWVNYVRRGQALLQCGEPVVDFLVWGAEDGNPGYFDPYLIYNQGCSYDLSSQADVQRLEVREEKRNGVSRKVIGVKGTKMTYKALYICDDPFLHTPQTTAKLKELKDNGALIYWSKDVKVEELSNVAGVQRPFVGNSQLRAIRRRNEKGETLWFIANTSDHDYAGDVSFGLYDTFIGNPFKLDAVTGKIDILNECKGDAAGCRSLHLSIPARRGVFVGFLDKTVMGLGVNTTSLSEGRTYSLNTDWEIVSFDGKNAPDPRPMKFLKSWSVSDDEKLKYFAGRAVYTHKLGTNKEAILDLGDVREVANVFVDGKFVACLWDYPFRVKIPAGEVLSVEVINTWPNRMIGDAVAKKNGAKEKNRGDWPRWVVENHHDSGTGIFTWSNWREGWNANSPLLPSGLLGPVTLEK